MKTMRWLLPLAALLLPLAGPSLAAELQGRILGEKCVKQGEIGDCYLKWAEPMVLWDSETGDYYYIELAGKEATAEAGKDCSPDDFCFQGKDLTQVALDKSFGQGKALVRGEIVGEDTVRVSRLELESPPSEREFTPA